MSSVLLDSGAWIAMVNPNDSLHGQAAEHYRGLSGSGTGLMTTDYVVDEAATRLRYDASLRAALEFRRLLEAAQSAGWLRLVWVAPRHFRDSWAVMEQYADVKFSFTDATSIVIAREARAEIFGFNSAFAAAGLTVQPGPSET